jgi:hypothetical protein
MKVPVFEVFAATVTELLFSVVTTVSGVPLSIWYVKVYGAVPPEPVNVIKGAAAFWHTVAFPVICPEGLVTVLLLCFPRLYLWNKKGLN